MNKSCLVLSGGNVRGAYQAGVIYALKPEIQNSFGVSIGAINGLLYNYLGPEGMKEYWMGIRSRDEFLTLGVWDLLKFKIPKGIYKTDKLKAVLQDVVNNNKPRHESYAVYYDSSKGNIQVHSNKGHDYVKAVVASASEPIYMYPQGDWYDGGLRTFCPIDVAKFFGIKSRHILAIITKPIEKDAKPMEPKNIFSAFSIASNAFSREVFENDIYQNQDVEIIAPNSYLIDRFNFDHESIKRAFDHGIEDGISFNGLCS
jgi:predicted acylesterase/phospholipase RssA